MTQRNGKTTTTINSCTISGTILTQLPYNDDDEQGDKRRKRGKLGYWAVGRDLAFLTIRSSTLTSCILVSAFTPPFSTVDHSEPRFVLDNYRWPAGINDFLWQTQGTGGGG